MNLLAPFAPRVPIHADACALGPPGWALAGLLVAVLALGGCAGPANHESAATASTTSGREVERGIASWYGEKFQGRRTASGESFDMNDFTAAHKTLPFGTRVRVRHATTGREVTVRINDRGPFTKGRVIDLSRAAAEAIGIIQAGVAPVIVFAP
ncbi:septal ring lytic transglycosylase RlpA family protein [Hydrogenophaga sp.]|uniref:septal ring lytic transglycosylase RlpA family protein n=1 Tax=Hydrogenophaga sp. TaxID=1904254 RepID=UPI003D140EBB